MKLRLSAVVSHHTLTHSCGNTTAMAVLVAKKSLSARWPTVIVAYQVRHTKSPCIWCLECLWGFAGPDAHRGPSAIVTGPLHLGTVFPSRSEKNKPQLPTAGSLEEKDLGPQINSNRATYHPSS